MAAAVGFAAAVVAVGDASGRDVADVREGFGELAVAALVVVQSCWGVSNCLCVSSVPNTEVSGTCRSFGKERTR